MYIKDYPFPSPIGELHFSIPSGTRPRRTHQGFRPLSGSYISQFETLNGAVYKPANVSVPYRGATFLNTDKIFLTLQAHTFPSPIGELHFSIVTCKLANKTFSKFPSPIGELHFSINESNGGVEVTTLFPSPIGELHFSIQDTI